MWPANLTLPKIKLGKVLSSHHASKNDVVSIKTKTDTTVENEDSNRIPLNENLIVTAAVTNVGRRNMKKSREERYTDDMQSQIPTQAILEVSTDTTSIPLMKVEAKLSDISNVKFLCKGSHSRVFKGIHNHKTIIIKVLADSSVNKPVAQMEFKLEKDILSRISHPNILNIIGCGEVSSKVHTNCNRPLMILEALTGGTLSYHLNKHKRKCNKNANCTTMHSQIEHSSMPFTEMQFIRMAKQFADAVWYLHEKFASNCILIHRDLKPDNIGFSEDGVLKLMDFGLSTTVKKNATQNDLYELSGCTGSYRYMAPEVALNRAYNEKVDIYSYGLILYETLTGVTPFQDNNKEEFYIKVVYGNERPSFSHDELGVPITSILDSKFATACDTENQRGYYLGKLKQFIEACWDPMYTNRPSAKDAVEMFDMLETAISNVSLSNISTGRALEENTISNTNCNKLITENNPRMSMLASQGDYSWTKESVNTPVSDANTSKDGSTSKEGSLSVTLPGSQQISPTAATTPSKQQMCYRNGKPTCHIESSLKATISTSSLHSNTSRSSSVMELQVQNPIASNDTISCVIRPKGRQNGIISRSYHALVKRLVRQY